MFHKNSKKNRHNNIAQITSEYAVLVSAIVIVLTTMQVYLRRGVQARIRDAANYPVASGIFNTSQYEPSYSNSTSQAVSQSKSSYTVANDMAVNRELRIREISTEETTVK